MNGGYWAAKTWHRESFSFLLGDAINRLCYRPQAEILNVTDGWKKISADIRLSRIIAISKKYGWNSADCRYFFLNTAEVLHIYVTQKNCLSQFHIHNLNLLSHTKQTHYRSQCWNARPLAVRHQPSTTCTEAANYVFSADFTWRKLGVSRIRLAELLRRIFSGRKFGGEYG